MTNNAACSRCSCTVEDALHTLKDCPTSKEVWVSKWPTTLVPEFFSLPLKDWLLKSLSLRPRAMGDEGWPERMVITMWNLWKWRNFEVFGGGVTPLQQWLETIIRACAETGKAWGRPKHPGVAASPPNAQTARLIGVG